MQFGAVDYVQKPFTDDELIAFTNRLLIRRRARQEEQQRPAVRLVAPEVADAAAERDYCVPGGVFLSPGHTWARLGAAGNVWVGLDDFARRALRRIERVDLPAIGTRVHRGGLLFVARRGDEIVRLAAPVSGEVTQVNEQVQRDPALMLESPYDRGWVCQLRPSDLAGELSGLRIGKPVIAWYQDEVLRLRKETRDAPDGICRWPVLEEKFLSAGAAQAPRRVEAMVGR
jgi:glycine cleavage system H lipoate-binding protein